MQLDFTGELTEEHKKEMSRHGNFSQDHIVDHYNELCSHYEQIYLRVGFHDPLRCAELAKFYLENSTETSEILDMGCGTGLVGKYLSDKGFKKIVGIDASAGMLSKAGEKGIYSELHELFLGQPKTFPDEFRNRFNGLTASGILAEGHLDN